MPVLREDVQLQAHAEGPHQQAHGQAAARVQALRRHVHSPGQSVRAHQAPARRAHAERLQVRDLSRQVHELPVAETAPHLAAPRQEAAAAERVGRIRRPRFNAVADDGGATGAHARAGAAAALCRRLHE